MNKAQQNYLLDVAIGISFLFSAISGLVFLLPVSSGINFRFWGQVHTWSSLVMICGVFFHLVLHWKWIVNMTKRMFSGAGRQEVRSQGQPVANAMSRRRFLRLGAMAVAGAGLFLLGYKAISATRTAGTASEGSLEDTQPAEPSPQPETAVKEQPTPATQPAEPLLQPKSAVKEQPAPATQPAQPSPQPETAVKEQPTPMPTVRPAATPTPSPEKVSVACPFGMVNDPYPGRCKRYTDRNGNGICDYSEPGSGKG